VETDVREKRQSGRLYPKGLNQVEQNNLPTVMPPHVVIVGGGFGGLAAARALARAPVRITVVDRHNYHLFQPLLYQVATAGLSPGDIASPIRWVLRKQSNVRVILADLRAVETAHRRILLDEGELAYDCLILAPGASDTYFGHDQWKQVAPGLKTLDDALEVRRRVLLSFERAERLTNPAELACALTFVVVGAGPTGVELAGALAEIARHALAREFRSIEPGQARILLVEAASTILTTFPPRLQAAAERSLAALGVEVRKNAPVDDIGQGWVQIGGERIAACTVLWAAGVAASPLGRTLGVPLDRAGRVLVEPDLTIPGHPEVFVIGDLAAFLHQTGKPLPGLAPVAVQQARSAASNIEARLRGEPTRPFRYRDLGNLATIGRAAAVADLGWLRFSGYPAWVIWLFVHLMKLVGFRGRLLVFVQWAWAYFTYQRSVRLIIGSGSAKDGDP
jgi:NADH dehydrogenase